MTGEPIRNLSSLNREIQRLETDLKRKGDQLEMNLNYLQDNYGKMTLNSFMHKPDAGRESIKEKIFSAVWENDVVQKGIDSVVSHMAEGASSLIDQFLNRIRPGKDAKG